MMIDRTTPGALPGSDGRQSGRIEVCPRQGASSSRGSRLSRVRERGCGILFVLILGTSLIQWGCGEGRPKVSRVGVLCGLDVFATTVDGFKAGMTDLGYTEGVNIHYDVKRTNFDTVEEERLLWMMVADKVDVMLVFPSEVAVAAKRVTRESGTPVVFCQTNIEGTDLIDSVSEPGGNMTGVRYPGPDLAIKRFEILKEMAPHTKRIWVPYARSSPIIDDQLKVLRPVAQKAGVTLVEAPAFSAADLLKDLDARAKAVDIDAVLLISEPLARTPAVFRRIAEFARTTCRSAESSIRWKTIAPCLVWRQTTSRWANWRQSRCTRY